MTKPKIANALDLATLRSGLIDDVGEACRRTGFMSAEKAREIIRDHFESWLEDYDADNDEAAAREHFAALDQAAREACESKRGRWPG